MGRAAGRSETTRLLKDIHSLDETDREARNRLFAAVYDELRRLAAALMRRERGDHTLRPTALVHEVYLRLIQQDDVSWENRAHFFGIAARAMRQILIDHARGKAALKRGGDLAKITLDEAFADDDRLIHDWLDLDAALDRLAQSSERVARVVELRIFGGLEMNEVALALDVSKRTAEGDWTFARMWLGRELSRPPRPDSPGARA